MYKMPETTGNYVDEFADIELESKNRWHSKERPLNGSNGRAPCKGVPGVSHPVIAPVGCHRIGHGEVVSGVWA